MNAFKFSTPIAALFAAALLWAVPAGVAGAIDLNLTSGSQWLSSDTLQPGWQTLEFDDSSWDTARAPYPNPTAPGDLIPGTLAVHIWHDPDSLSDGTNGVVEAWFRLNFSLDLVSANAPVTADALVNVDDDYELYVNGNLVLENHDGGFGNQVDSIAFGEYLRHGDNVIAIHGMDGSWDNPRDRGAERLLFDATVADEPRVAVVIRSDGTWRSNDSYVAGWANHDFDDSGWPAARAPYPGATAPQSLLPDSVAQLIWHDPMALSDGTNGPIEVFLRHTFQLDVDPALAPVVGQVRANVDDDYDLYVNGHLVHENHDLGFSSQVDDIDFTWALRHGQNVIAVHAVDGEWGIPWDRGGERVLVEGIVATGTLEWTFEPLITYYDFWNCIGDPIIKGSEVLFMSSFDGCFASDYLAETSPGVHRIDVDEGTGTTLVRPGDVLPDGTGVFGFYTVGAKPAQDDDTLAFIASGTDWPFTQIIQKGIYFDPGTGLEAAATDTTPIPDGTDVFTEFGALLALSNDEIAFFGRRYSPPEPTQAGIYLYSGGLLSKIAKLDDPLATGGGVITGFGYPDLDEFLVTFLIGGRLFDDTEIEGIYAESLGTGMPYTVADSTMTMPDTSKIFGEFDTPATSDGLIVFWGNKPDPDGHQGIYRWHVLDQSLEIVIDEDDPAPGDEGETLFSFDFTPVTHAHNIAFEGTRGIDEPPWIVDGLYTTLGLGMTKVIDDMVEMPDLFPEPDHAFDVMNSSQGALNGNRLVFRAGDILGVAYIFLADDDFFFAADSDADGIVDLADNCILEANPAQTDTNGDGYGNACDADLTNDGNVNFGDVAAFKSAFPPRPYDPDADFNRDGFINIGDLAVMKKGFLKPPGPSAFAP